MLESYISSTYLDLASFLCLLLFTSKSLNQKTRLLFALLTALIAIFMFLRAPVVWGNILVPLGIIGKHSSAILDFTTSPTSIVLQSLFGGLIGLGLFLTAQGPKMKTLRAAAVLTFTYFVFLLPQALESPQTYVLKLTFFKVDIGLSLFLLVVCLLGIVEKQPPTPKPGKSGPGGSEQEGG